MGRKQENAGGLPSRMKTLRSSCRNPFVGLGRFRCIARVVQRVGRFSWRNSLCTPFAHTQSPKGTVTQECTPNGAACPSLVRCTIVHGASSRAPVCTADIPHHRELQSEAGEGGGVCGWFVASCVAAAGRFSAALARTCPGKVGLPEKQTREAGSCCYYPIRNRGCVHSAVLHVPSDKKAVPPNKSSERKRNEKNARACCLVIRGVGLPELAPSPGGVNERGVTLHMHARKGGEPALGRQERVPDTRGPVLVVSQRGYAQRTDESDSILHVKGIQPPGQPNQRP